MKANQKPRTGLCCVYVMHSDGFNGLLRPAYDTAPTGRMTMSNTEVRTLTSMIHRYMRKCAERRKP